MSRFWDLNLPHFESLFANRPSSADLFLICFKWEWHSSPFLDEIIWALPILITKYQTETSIFFSEKISLRGIYK